MSQNEEKGGMSDLKNEAFKKSVYPDCIYP